MRIVFVFIFKTNSSRTNRVPFTFNCLKKEIINAFVYGFKEEFIVQGPKHFQNV